MWAALGLATAQARLSVGELVVALKPDKNPDAMLAEQRALEGFLGERLGGKVRVIVPLSTAVIVLIVGTYVWRQISWQRRQRARRDDG